MVEWCTAARRMPHELHKKLAQEAAKDSAILAVEDFRLGMDWSLTAAQTGLGGRDSVLKLDVLGLIDSTPAFQEWCAKTLDQMVGPRAGQGARASNPAGTTSDIVSALGSICWSVAQSLSSAVRNVSRGQTAAVACNEDKGKLYSRPQLAKIMGWSGTDVVHELSPCWFNFQLTKYMEKY